MEKFIGKGKQISSFVKDLKKRVEVLILCFLDFMAIFLSLLIKPEVL